MLSKPFGPTAAPANASRAFTDMKEATERATPISRAFARALCREPLPKKLSQVLALDTLKAMHLSARDRRIYERTMKAHRPAGSKLGRKAAEHKIGGLQRPSHLSLF